MKTFQENGDSPEPERQMDDRRTCVSALFPKEVAPEPVWMLCKREKHEWECHHDFSNINILTGPNQHILLKRFQDNLVS